jgi:glutathione S-transferase
LKLYGASLSTCTRRVALIATEKGVPYKLISVDLATGEQKTAAYREKQPFGVVPYIVRVHLAECAVLTELSRTTMA